jgi:small conductance mechanosensitive channel
MDGSLDIGSLALPWRILSFIGIAMATHLLVILIKHVAARFSHGGTRRVAIRKLQSLATLVTSGVVFTLYFLMTGFILSEFGVSLAAYLASASVLGLAIGFGSQGVVQDVVTGLTLIFSDLFDVGDLVEISGQTGIVKGITMRFVELENALGGTVFIPNRTINNVINYPRGYVRCLVDVTLLGDAAQKDRMQETAMRLMSSFHQQFPGILVTRPSIESRQRLESGKEFLRIKFRVWPNRGAPIESTFRQELEATLHAQNPDYQAWMISVFYEVEARSTHVRPVLPWLLTRRATDRRRESAPAAAEAPVKEAERRG